MAYKNLNVYSTPKQRVLNNIARKKREAKAREVVKTSNA